METKWFWKFLSAIFVLEVDSILHGVTSNFVQAEFGPKNVLSSLQLWF